MSIDIYLTNLGKYNEGYLIGKWVKLPIAKDKLEEAFTEIQIDGKMYEEYFITDSECQLRGIACAVDEYADLRTLNELAEKLDELSLWEAEKLEAVLEYDSQTSISSILAVIDVLDEFDLYEGIDTEEDLGYYYIKELGAMDIPEHLENYFDYEAYGRDIHLGSCGTFTTYGYLMDNR